MRTIYSLKEFREAVIKIASGINETYTFVRVTFENDGSARFECYINNKGLVDGKTMEECLQKMRNSTNQPVINDIDVEIEMEVNKKVFEEVNPADDLPF